MERRRVKIVGMTLPFHIPVSDVPLFFFLCLKDSWDKTMARNQESFQVHFFNNASIHPSRYSTVKNMDPTKSVSCNTYCSMYGIDRRFWVLQVYLICSETEV